MCEGGKGAETLSCPRMIDASIGLEELIMSPMQTLICAALSFVATSTLKSMVNFFQTFLVSSKSPSTMSIGQGSCEPGRGRNERKSIGSSSALEVTLHTMEA